jgi:hypothetical protein
VAGQHAEIAIFARDYQLIGFDREELALRRDDV